MATMNFLQLVNRIKQKVGIPGADLTTVQGVTGEFSRLKNWVDEAWVAIQEIHPDWDWMRKNVSFTTTPSQSSYTPVQCGVTDLGKWKIDSFRTYITDVGVPSEVFLGELDWGLYRDTYLYGNMRNVTGRPISIAVGPSDLSLNLGLTPDTIGYTVVGEYFKEPVHLSADSDVPDFQGKYHMLIVYRAMMFYGSFESAPEVYADGLQNYNEMVRRLNNEQLQDVTLGSL